MPSSPITNSSGNPPKPNSMNLSSFTPTTSAATSVASPETHLNEISHPIKQNKGQPRIRICLVGAGGVGKSCFAIQYIKKRFVREYDPTIVDAHNFERRFNGISHTCQVFDTAGQLEYSDVCKKYYQQADIYILMYSLDNQYSLKTLHKFHNLIYRLKETVDKEIKYLPIVLVGNKSDLDPDERRVSLKEGKSLAIDFGNAPFFLTSAKTAENVDAAFAAAFKLFFKMQGVTDVPELSSKSSLIHQPRTPVSYPQSSKPLNSYLPTQPAKITSDFSSHISMPDYSTLSNSDSIESDSDSDLPNNRKPSSSKRDNSSSRLNPSATGNHNNEYGSIRCQIF